VKRFFTLFFIPIVPISTRHFAVCTTCALTQPVAPQVAAEVAALRTLPPPPAAAYPGSHAATATTGEAGAADAVRFAPRSRLEGIDPRAWC